MSAGSPDAHVALLRGVNVGGANILAMDELRRLFESAGCLRVRTILQSGNVVFEASRTIVGGLAPVIEARLLGAFGIAAPVILRSNAAIAEIARNNPFLEAGSDPALLHLMCLKERPSEEAVATLDPLRSPPDAFAVRGADIYLRLPNGVARSKLTNAYFDRTLRNVGTARNWRTMTRIGEALAAPPEP